MTSLVFEVVRADASTGLRAGDRLRWDGSRPRGQRVVLERSLPTWHEGRLDRAVILDSLRPLGTTASEARAVFVARLLQDQQQTMEAVA